MIRYSATIDGEAWKINVHFECPPIPVRTSDWFAGFDNEEGYGEYGATLEDALEALLLDKMDMQDYCLLSDKPEGKND